MMKTSSKTIEEINEVLLLRLLELLPLAKDGYRYLESLEYYEEGLKEAMEKIGMAHRLIEYIGNHDTYVKSQTEKWDKHLDILHNLIDHIQNNEVNPNSRIDKLINIALHKISKL